MDVHEWFSYHIKELKECVKKIEELENKKEDFNGTEPTEWELFVNFVESLYCHGGDYYKKRLIEALIGYDAAYLPIYEKIRILFDSMAEDERIDKIEYVSGNDKIIVDYNSEEV